MSDYWLLLPIAACIILLRWILPRFRETRQVLPRGAHLPPIQWALPPSIGRQG